MNSHARPRFSTPSAQPKKLTVEAAEKKITDMCYHIRSLRRRNYLLQASLDVANAQIAKRQREQLEALATSRPSVPSAAAPLEWVSRGFACLGCRNGSAIGGHVGHIEFCQACQPAMSNGAPTALEMD